MDEDKRIPARINANVMALPSKGGISDFRSGREGFVHPETTKNSFGSPHFVWLEDWNDGMGGSGCDIYYVPAFAVELLS